ncbi:hypothetical protein ABC974_06810 [Sphingomonas oligophenolica]|uniref:Uncharacterized protein n=1 Tax=Sphingomonas oligophenolica TaxID=301154 RepID=A0ABU9Y0N8_9SPHN
MSWSRKTRWFRSVRTVPGEPGHRQADDLDCVGKGNRVQDNALRILDIDPLAKVDAASQHVMGDQGAHLAQRPRPGFSHVEVGAFMVENAFNAIVIVKKDSCHAAPHQAGAHRLSAAEA